MFKKLIITILILILLATGIAQAKTLLFPDRGGTGQDSSDWTGFPYVTSGAWGTTTALSLSGGTLTGDLRVNANIGINTAPSYPLHISKTFTSGADNRGLCVDVLTTGGAFLDVTEGVYVNVTSTDSDVFAHGLKFNVITYNK